MPPFIHISYDRAIDSSYDISQMLQAAENAAKRVEKQEQPSAKGWAEIPEAQMTPELKADLLLIKNRNVIDPKRHYKSTGWGKDLPTHVQYANVIEPASRYYSKSSKASRKGTLMGEFVASGKNEYVSGKAAELTREGAARRSHRRGGKRAGKGKK
ncbi:Fcf2 pre-rRNA processing [Carpediemonas membranifera]|uniref:Fcf2 pre-rRNA processing n=1 Tax=Carpediemonas membranifera TaxID=201153 RepID=A0A8J6B5H8_9EUKA|nr:Fcf2 pre-rRNA processing [Carpediemonas membranifera]|eukprot:KAG9393287.1 Fcf2 pre-rRNA processing [Carpediemonas membranifera]